MPHQVHFWHTVIFTGTESAISGAQNDKLHQAVSNDKYCCLKYCFTSYLLQFLLMVLIIKQGEADEELNYALIKFSERKTKGRKKREFAEDSVYSQVKCWTSWQCWSISWILKGTSYSVIDLIFETWQFVCSTVWALKACNLDLLHIWGQNLKLYVVLIFYFFLFWINKCFFNSSNALYVWSMISICFCYFVTSNNRTQNTLKLFFVQIWNSDVEIETVFEKHLTEYKNIRKYLHTLNKYFITYT